MAANAAQNRLPMDKIKEAIYPYITPVLMAVVAFFLREVYTKVDDIATEIRSLSEDRAMMLVKMETMSDDIKELEQRVKELEQNQRRK